MLVLLLLSASSLSMPVFFAERWPRLLTIAAAAVDCGDLLEDADVPIVDVIVDDTSNDDDTDTDAGDDDDDDDDSDRCW